MRSSTRLPAALAAAGVTGAAVAGGLALAAAELGALLPIGLACAWLAAGWLACRARPDALVARLLLAVGSTHLVAFGLTAPMSLLGVGSPAWWSWGLALLAGVLFAAGIVALAVLLAVFPNGDLSDRLPRALAGVGLVLAATVPLAAALTSPELNLALAGPPGSGSPPAPAGLPLGSVQVDLFPLLALLVLVGLVLLVRRAARATGAVRRQLAWPVGVGTVLVLLLLATPAGTRLLGPAWAAVFVVVVACLPFALLAGLSRYRLLEVDLYLARTVAHAAVLALVLSVYAAVAVLAGRAAPELSAVSAVVVVLAALTAAPLRQRVEALVDRRWSGGRLRGEARLRSFTQSLEHADGELIVARTAQGVQEALEVSWVRVVTGAVVAAAGDPGERPPQVRVPLAAAGEELGAVECGPRRGGWSVDEVQLLEAVGRQAALALRAARLSADLAHRVDELVASRARLVRAEEGVRRRLERDLHDGVQQQLVALLAHLEVLRSLLDGGTREGQVTVLAHAQARGCLAELRDLVRGIHPALLADRGLAAAVQARADLLPLSVTVDVDPRIDTARFAPEVEGAAYYVVCEALTNVVKHSAAAHARVLLAPADDGGLRVAVSDEGRGFTGTGAGTGLPGLRDRVEALGGRLDVVSAEGVGTTVVAHLAEQETVRA